MFDEKEILNDLSNGDREAFNLLYLLYAPNLENFVTNMIKNRQSAEDIVHNIFLKIWDKRNTIYQIDSFKQYVFKMAKNAIYDLFDHDLVKVRYKQNMKQTPQLYISYNNMQEEIEANDLSLLIDIAINKMPNKRRTVFLLSRKEGLSHKEIAEKLNISTKTVENHITQAISEIREAIS